LQSCKLLFQLHLGLVRFAARLAELLDYLTQMLTLLLLQGPTSDAATAVYDMNSGGRAVAGTLQKQRCNPIPLPMVVNGHKQRMILCQANGMLSSMAGGALLIVMEPHALQDERTFLV
jgi:hypothetical protein